MPYSPETARREGDAALLALLQALKARSYRFITPTPATHARILGRDPEREAADLADAIGWSRPFRTGTLEPEIERLLTAAEALEPIGDGRWKCRYRVSSLENELFLHSAYPTNAEDAVFFGPDSYRFADLVRRELERRPEPSGSHLADIGTGAGVGAIAAARACPDLRLTMTDINPAALRLARINARAAGVTAKDALGAHLEAVEDPIDLALANPPYIIDNAGRDYRDGGDMHGGGVARDMTVAVLDRLAPGGRFILYTGSAIIRGRDELGEVLAALAVERDCSLRYREIDPDIFGEELERPCYRDVERIALVSAVFSRLATREADPSLQRPWPAAPFQNPPVG